MGNQQLTYGYDIDEECDDLVDSGYDEDSTNSSASSSLNTTTAESVMETSLHATSTQLLNSDLLKKSFFTTNTSQVVQEKKEEVEKEKEQKVVQFNFAKEINRNEESDLIYYSGRKKRLSIVKSKSIGISIANEGRIEIDRDEYDPSCEECLEFNSKFSSSWSPKSTLIENNKNTIKYQLDKSNSQPNSLTEKKVESQVSKYSPYSFSFRQGMNFVGKFVRGAQQLYSEINPATLTGAIDVVVVQQEDGSFKCSPFHVRFGKLGVIKSREKKVYIEINDEIVDLNMELGDAGEAYFVEKCSLSDDVNNGDEYDEIISSTESLTKPLELPNDIATNSATSLTNDINTTSYQKVSTPITTLNATTPIQIKSECVKTAETSTATVAVSVSPSDSSSAFSVLQTPNNNMASTSSSSLLGGGVGLKPPGPGYFLSDGEITPELTSPVVSRPPTPKSDSEMEPHKTRKQSITTEIANQWNWSWGQLPVRQNNNVIAIANSKTSSSTPQTTQIQPETPVIINKSSKENVSTSTSPSSRLLGGVFNLISSGTSSSSTAAVAAGKGLYLEDTEKLDSEIAALYLDQKSNKTPTSAYSPPSSQNNLVQQQRPNDDDQESGKGHSLPQSPLRDSYSILGDVQISLCGFQPQSNLITTPTTSTSLLTLNDLSPNISSNNDDSTNTSVSSEAFEDLFQQHAVPFERFMEEITTITANPNLVLKINNRFMNWASASPIILSAILYQKNLPNDTVNMVLDTHMPKAALKTETTVTTTTSTLTKSSEKQQAVAVTTTVAPMNEQKRSTWGKMFWGSGSSSSTTKKSAPTPQEQQSAILTATKTTTTTTTTTTVTLAQNASKNSTLNPNQEFDYRGLMIGDEDEEIVGLNKQQSSSRSATNLTSSLDEIEKTLLNDDNGHSITFEMDPPLSNINGSSTTIKLKKSHSTKESLDESQNYFQASTQFGNANLLKSYNHNHVHHKKYAEAKAEFSLKQKINNTKYRKTTRLSSDLIKKLNLKPGPNEIKYSVTTALQGTTRIISYIFLWNYDDKIIVSDIDGTITKSDVWGQVLPIFGRDWSQAGVADLFTAIQRNEYKFIYLSARAIGQSKLTRDLLRNINQDGFTLPEGPLLVTPTSLFTAFQKEVIERKPEEFKISCLKDIQSLFPSNNNPYYAGYGNKPTDVTSYKAVGIPVSRIFTINPQGEVKYEVSRTFQSSYSKLCDYVDLIFPPFKASSSVIKAEYDAFNYWRDDPTCNNDKFMAEIDAIVNVKEKNGKNAKKSKSQVSVLVDNNVETIRKNVNDK